MVNMSKICISLESGWVNSLVWSNKIRAPAFAKSVVFKADLSAFLPNAVAGGGF